MDEPKPPPPPPPTTRAAANYSALHNFRALVVHCAMVSAPTQSFNFAEKDIIEQRIQESVPSFPTPRHSTYAWMIENAIEQLDAERGSSAESISKFILAEHKDLLPRAHATLLKHHLQNLCECGTLVESDDGFYFLGKETNGPKPASEPDPSLNAILVHKAIGPISSLDYGYESDSTSSSGESYNPTKERKMSQRRKNNSKGIKTRRQGKNVQGRNRGEKRDWMVGINLEQENGVNEERVDEPQRVVSRDSISRVRMGKQGKAKGRKRGRSRKNITTISNQTAKPRKRLGRPRKNKDLKIEESGKALMGQDEVLAEKENKQKEDQEFRPNNEVYLMDDDNIVKANMTGVEQCVEDIVDVDEIIDQVCMELQKEKETQSFTIEDEVIPPRAEEQHIVQGNKDLVKDGCHAEPSTMVIDIVPEEQECEVSMESTESLQKDALIEETGKNMTETKDCLMNDVELQEQECEENKLSGDSDVIEEENHLKDVCEILVEHDEQAITEQNQTEEQECKVSIERTESLQNDVLEETGKNMNMTEANGIRDQIEVKFEKENQNELNETKECDEEMECYVDEQSVEKQTCLMNDAELQEQEYEDNKFSGESDVVEEENHLKDACEILEECDEQAITEQNQPEEQECEVGMERTESLQKDVHIKETGKNTKMTEANGMGDLIEELKFEKENQNELNETKECDEMERSVNEQSVEDQACETNDVELQEQEYEENKFSGESEEVNHLKDACEFLKERDQQAITKHNQLEELLPVLVDGEKENEELEHFDKRSKHGRETDNEQYQSQKVQEDGFNEGESQQLEEQEQELGMHEEYENLDEAGKHEKETNAEKRLSEKEQIDAPKEQEQNEDVNQQLKEQNEDVNQQLKEQKQDAVEIGEHKGVSEGMMGIEILVEFGENSCVSMLECEQNSVSEKMEQESNSSEGKNALGQHSDTLLNPKMTTKVKSVNVVQLIEKRQLRPRSNKSHSKQSEEKENLIVPILEKSSEINQRDKLRVTKQQEQGIRRSSRLQKSRSGN